MLQSAVAWARSDPYCCYCVSHWLSGLGILGYPCIERHTNCTPRDHCACEHPYEYDTLSIDQLLTNCIDESKKKCND